MKRIAVLVLALVVLAEYPLVFGQAQTSPAPPGRQGAGAPQGRQGGGGRQTGDGRQGGGARQGRGVEAVGTAVIQGRVLAADTGTPVRRATVQATSNGGSGRPRAATTDMDGRFVLRDLPAGLWRVSASKNGFVTQQLGQRRALEVVDPTDLADGQLLTADFSLARGGVITGRIYDEFGDPLVDARVQAVRPGTTVSVTSGRGAPTDDTGAFRLYGLPPGAYHVVATVAAVVPTLEGPLTERLIQQELQQAMAQLRLATGRTGNVNGPDTAVTYAPTYFPGTVNITEAQRVTLTPGEEQANVNFTIVPARLVRVSGTILNSNGAPVQGTLTLRADSRADLGLAGGNATMAAADGTFTISNVLPGTYVLEATSRGPTGGQSREVAAMPVVVGGSDLLGLTVVTGRGASITGTMAADNGARLQTSGVQVMAQSLRQGPALARVQVSSTGSFELTGLVGAYSLRIDRLPTGWAVKSIIANGVDVTDTPLELRGSEQVSARVLLTDRLTDISGTIRSAGQPTPGASVLVFPDDPARWGTTSRYVRSARADKEGAYRIRALPPDERYLTVAVEYLEQGELQDPEFLQRMKGRASSFTLSEGEQKKLDVTVISR